MSNPNVLKTLHRKRDDIENAIVTYEKRLAEARTNLAHVNATIRLFESATAPADVRVYQDIHRLFRRGELVTLCKAALAERGPLDTRELSAHVVRAKGFDEADKELRKAIAYKIVQALRMQLKRGAIGEEGKRNNVWVWRLQA